MTDATTNTGAPKRPTFLTVLCILSFIGCGIGVVSGITGYFTNKALASTNIMEEAMAQSDDPESAAMAMDMMGDLGMDFGKMATNSLAQGLLCIVVLIGVIMMWKQKKTGFYVYTVSNLAYAICPFIFLGGLVGGLAGTLGAIMSIIFIILYALNLKHMR